MKPKTQVACYFPANTNMATFSFAKHVKELNEISQERNFSLEFYLLSGAPTEHTQETEIIRIMNEKPDVVLWWAHPSEPLDFFQQLKNMDYKGLKLLIARETFQKDYDKFANETINPTESKFYSKLIQTILTLNIGQKSGHKITGESIII